MPDWSTWSPEPSRAPQCPVHARGTWWSATGSSRPSRRRLPTRCLAALATAAADGDVTIESLVGLVPLGGSHPVDSFAFVWWPGADTSEVTAVVRGDAVVDLTSPGGTRRFDSRGIRPWHLAEFGAVVGIRVTAARGPARPPRRGDRPGAPRPCEPPGVGGGVGGGGGAATAGCLGRGRRHHPDAARPAGGGGTDRRRRSRRPTPTSSGARRARSARELVARSADARPCPSTSPRSPRRGGDRADPEPTRRLGCSAATGAPASSAPPPHGAGASREPARAAPPGAPDEPRCRRPPSASAAGRCIR